MSDEKLKLSWNILGWALDAIAGVALIAGIWCTKTIINIDGRLQQTEIILQRVESSQREQVKALTELTRWQAATQASRFTNDDGQQLWKEIAEIHKQMAKQEVPDWLKKDLARIEKELERLNTNEKNR